MVNLKFLSMPKDNENSLKKLMKSDTNSIEIYLTNVTAKQFIKDLKKFESKIIAKLTEV